MEASKNMDFDKIMDYTYPKLFTIAPRAAMKEQLEKTFNNESIKVELDSLKATKIHPEFTVEENKYAKINYSMLMRMHIKSAESGTSQMDFIVASLKEKYGEDKVSVNESGVIKINMTSNMVAIKEKSAKEWTFINLNAEDKQLMDKLLSKEVQDKLATYN